MDDLHRPPQVVGYDAHTQALSYYVEWAGAVSGVTRYQVKYYRNGALYYTYGMHTFDAAAGNMMNGCTFAPTTYPPGRYRLDLFVDGTRARSTTFSIGRHLQRRPAPPTGAVAIPILFTVAPTLIATWDRQGPPTPLAQLGHRPARIAYFFEWSGATPGATKVRVAIYDPKRTSYEVPLENFTMPLSEISAGRLDWVNNAIYQLPGKYELDLYIGPRVVARTHFWLR
jgi:hypothetical protein